MLSEHRNLCHAGFAVSILALILLPASAGADGTVIGVDGGASRYSFDGPFAYDLNAYLGWQFDSGLTPDLQVGLKRAATTVSSTNSFAFTELTLVPFLFGGRQSMRSGPLGFFIGAHVGPVYTTGEFKLISASPLPFGVGGRYSKWRFGFDLGTGVEYVGGNETRLGIVFWYTALVATDAGLNIFGLGIEARHAFLD